MSQRSSSMHRYPRNSPRLAARIVAVALISNGEIKPSEAAALETLRVHEQLGLTCMQWHDVIDELCSDLLRSARPGADCHIELSKFERLLDDVDDVTLQRLVLRLCTALINADREVDDGESAVLRATVNRWELYPEEHELVEPLLYGLDFQVTQRRTQ